jgi:hypothetical protein
MTYYNVLNVPNYLPRQQSTWSGGNSDYYIQKTLYNTPIGRWHVPALTRRPSAGIRCDASGSQPPSEWFQKLLARPHVHTFGREPPSPLISYKTWWAFLSSQRRCRELRDPTSGGRLRRPSLESESSPPTLCHNFLVNTYKIWECVILFLFPDHKEGIVLDETSLTSQGWSAVQTFVSQGQPNKHFTHTYLWILWE